ncbi:unconventional myosin-XVB-like [Dendropsophus ebraccatus]|uniref:unconventional myosin-XVB-like n=1 Tax=Dendropsophus ebraccatus TaxID=150705 RepID=UPI003831F034
MRLLSTSRLVNQYNQSSHEKTTLKSLDKNNSKDTAKNPSHENKIDSASKMKKLCESSEAEDASGTVDAKYAIVFPRIHHLAKTIKISPAAQRSTCNTGQRLVVSVQPATSSRNSKITLTETKNSIQNRPENRPRYRPLQILESRSLSRQQLDPNEEPQVLLGSSKNKVRKENEEQSDDQNQTAPAAETALNNSEVGSSFVDSTQDGDEEVEQSSSYEATTHVHWAQNVPGRNDPTGWLSSETLLPRLTIENLSKWTIYQEVPHTKSTQPMQQPRERWEAEDSTEDMLQMAMKKKQVQDGEECPEVEELSDLSFLENVCESAVLLCLKKRFHRDAIYTSIGHMLLSVNPFKALNICSIDMAEIYQDNKTMERPPHIYSVVEEAYALYRISEHAPNILISGHTGSGKTEAVKVIVQYLTTPNMRQGDRPLQIFDFLTVLESFGNAKTVLNCNSTRCGQILQMFFRSGALVGCSVTHYLLEKFRVVFQAVGERGFHIFYELLDGLSETEKQRLYLQEPETYYYLNQGRACDLPGKNDKMDFMVLQKCLRGIGLSDIELTSIWAILSAILQLGNICFTSFHSDTFSAAAGFRITEIRIVANLLQISPEGLQRSITQRVTRTSYDRALSPLSVEASIDVRDTISQTLYALLFDWLVEKGNDWLCARETDGSLGIIDICGFENLGVNSLEQLCRNFANEQIQRHSIESLISQEQAEYAREGLCWVPFSTEGSESCIGLLTDRPHGILQILEEQSKLTQATDHTFLQKCHYHHGDSSCYIKPKLPLPVFTLQHYCGPVTYQVHNFLSKNRDRLPAFAREVLAQSRLKLLSDIVKRESNVLQPQGGTPPNPCLDATLTGRFQLTLQELTFRLKRGHTLFVRCISPNPTKLPGIFDVEFVSSQLRNSGILEAVQLIKDGYPIRIPLGQFVNRYGHLAGKDTTFPEDREYCAAVLRKIFGDSSALYQLGMSKVFLKERAREILQRKWEEIQSSAALMLQKNLRGFLNRKNFQQYRRKITVVQAHVRGRQARQRYRKLKNTRVQFGAVLLISKISSIHRRICQVTILKYVI